MRVLALDLGTHAGWAVSNRALDAPQASGTMDLTPRRGESPGFRYLRLRSKLEEIRSAYPDLTIVAYEMPHQRGGAASEVLLGCATTVQSWCAEHSLQHVSVHSATLKKSATGKGNASKEEMVAAAKAKGWKPANDDEADALHLLDYALKELL